VARGQFYLDKSNAKLAGVCSGIADYTGVDALWVRLAVVFLTLFVVPFLTIPAYIVAALTANKRPSALYSPEEEDRLLRRQMQRGRNGRIRSDLSEIDRRVANIEARYSSSNARLAAEIDSLR
jgi:phage shock protein C